MSHRTGWRCREDLVHLVEREIEDGADPQEAAERAVNTVGEFILDGVARDGTGHRAFSSGTYRGETGMSLWGDIKDAVAKVADGARKEEQVAKKMNKATQHTFGLTEADVRKLSQAIFQAGGFQITSGSIEFGLSEPEPLPEREQSEPILGFRGWRLRLGDFDGPRLQSVTAGDVWEGPILRAEHEPRDRIWEPRTAHLENRDLGIFAYPLVEGAYRTVTEHSWPVIGLVEMVGKVVVHTRGYRAEACRIRELWVEPREADPETREALARLYQCEVHADDLPTDRPLHVDDLSDVNECPMCGHQHPDSPLNCEEGDDHGDRQAEGDRESEGAIRTVSWEGGRSRIPAREEGAGGIYTGALSANAIARAYLTSPNP